jgi:putative pyruvate formate lyase activating enzyme
MRRAENSYRPSYIDLHESGELQARRDTLTESLSCCRLCPRACEVDRLSGETGFCGIGRFARVSAANPHYGEESPLVGRRGSGTVFFSGCNLLCSFCRNYDISHGREGNDVSCEELSSMMLHLAEIGCHNINLVTPTHVTASVLEALAMAVPRGLDIPLVYNCGGYESVETLRFLDGVVDIYMPDFKFWDSTWANRLCSAPDYRQRAVEAIVEMHRQVGDLKVDRDGIAKKGLLVRHLVMPGGIGGSENVLRFLAEAVGPETYVNVMDQYHPSGTASNDPPLDRRLTADEYRSALSAAAAAGLSRLDRRDRPRFFFKIF